MGRKPAPQPLELPDGNGLSHDTISTNTAESYLSQPSSARSPADPKPAKSPHASPLSNSAEQRKPHASLAAAQPRSSPVTPLEKNRAAEQGPTGIPAPGSSPADPSVPEGGGGGSGGNSSGGGGVHLHSRFNPAYAQAEGKKPSDNNKNDGGGGSFFKLNKATKSAVHTLSAHVHHQNSGTTSRSRALSRGSEAAAVTGTTASGRRDASSAEHPMPAIPAHTSEASLTSTANNDSAPGSLQLGKSKTSAELGRNRSLQEKKGGDETQPLPLATSNLQLPAHSEPIRTAPTEPERYFRDMMDSSNRNRSADRAPPIRDAPPSRDAQKERGPHPSSSHRDHHNGPSFFSGLKSSSSKAAGMLGNRFFGKNQRSGSTNEREPHLDDEHYTLKVINLPLVLQTRKTRISKRLEVSKDKTEFWMPAFPWRAIDYLNYKGCDVEGLYRVPGSGPQVKKWQRKFDERYDVNLFEEEDLYDINIIGSMLKAWLRELPDELFPKAAQDRISRECAGSEEVPQMLIDELSELPPFNYYLLFAITCHLSLLLSHSEKNKMDFRNLCICFQPCMKIDAFCFKFLVCDWRECWKGCKNEAKYLEEEYKLLDQPPSQGRSLATHEPATDRPSRAVTPRSDAASPVSASTPPQSAPYPPPVERQESSDSHHTPRAQESKQRPKMKPLQLSESNHSMGSNDSSISTQITKEEVKERSFPTDMRPLSPIAPLSPLGF